MQPERVNNPRCDGSHCRRTWGEIRKLPDLSGDGNSLLCYWCWIEEIKYRRTELNISDPTQLPNWRDLKVYKEI